MLHNLPNVLTVARFFFAIPVSISILYKGYSFALSLLCIAVLTDFLDGFLARKFLWESQIGAALDPLADKVLITACYLSLFIINLVPFWLIILVMLKDLILLTIIAFHNRIVLRVGIRPSIFGKFATFLQMLLAITILLFKGSHDENNTYDLFWFFFIVAFFTTISGLQNLYIWFKYIMNRLIKNNKSKKN